MNRICSACDYWMEEPGEGFGECRRHAPQPNPSIERTLPYWPTTKEDEWCGEFKPAPDQSRRLPPPIRP
jgi:hypothetical protein